MDKLNSYENSNISKFIVDGSPSDWLLIAEELMDAAEILWNKNDGSLKSEIFHNNKIVLDSKKVSSISRPYFLLVGIAMEIL